MVVLQVKEAKPCSAAFISFIPRGSRLRTSPPAYIMSLSHAREPWFDPPAKSGPPAVDRLQLVECTVTEKSCSDLASVLSSDSSSLKDLDLSNNNLQDSGVRLLSHGLKDNCKLEKLRLSNCSINEEGYKALASALRSNTSHLIELDLRGNDPGPSGVKQLNDLLLDPKCKLETLRFLGPDAEKAFQYVTKVLGENLLLLRELNLSERELDPKQLVPLLVDKHCKLNILILNNSSITEEDCCALVAALNSNPSNLKELVLSGTKLRDSEMKNLSTLFENVQCRLEKLKLNFISITKEYCTALASAFNSNPSNLNELDLSGNQLGDSGVMEISTLLGNSQCTLQILRLSDCSISEEGYKALASALRSNPSHLIELDLTGNDPGPSGVKQLNDLLLDPNCKVKLRFLSPAADEACQYVNRVVGENPLLVRELNLSERELGDKNVKKLAVLLQDKHCKLNTLMLNNNSITAEGCAALTLAFNSNPSNLTELDLSGNKLGNSGIEKICPLLENPQCRLEKLKGNDPGPSGVKQLNDLLLDGSYKLKNIRFFKSPAAEGACEYLTKVLGESPLLMKELDLSGDKLGDLDGEKLSARLKNPVCELKILKLSKCSLTEESCSDLASVLSSDSSSLKDLDLSNNNLQDSGVKLLSHGLTDNCKLEKLRLSDCSITEEGYKALASALRSNPSHLIELDLTGNDPGPSGVKQLNDLLLDPKCKLETLRFLSPDADEAFQYVNRVVGENPLLVRELNLSERKLDLKKVKPLAALLKDKHCKLSIIQLNNNSITEEGCSALTSAFKLNPSNLTELDLSGNKLGKTGMQNICFMLKNPQCRLEKLKLSDCSITEESYKILTSALKPNPSHLLELDLTGNDPGPSGLQWFFSLFAGGTSKLKTISFLRSPAAEEAYKYLTDVLGTNPLLLQELDLSRIKLGDQDWENISALLLDSYCKVEKLKLNSYEMTSKSCSVLATVLCSKTTLTEMNLNNSPLQDSGVKEICKGLTKSKLEKLKLSNCSITEEGYKALASALRSNPSHLIELDLRGNDPGPSGVKQLSDLLQSKKCSLKTLRFLQSPAADVYQYLTSVLHTNLLLERELNLSERKLDLKTVNQLAALLQDKHCKFNKLQLCGCGLAEQSCSALATVLRSNSSLKELDMSNNNLQDSGVKKLKSGLENTDCTLEKLRLSNCSISEEGYKALASALRSNPSHLIELDLRGNDPGPSGVKQLNDLLLDPNCQLETLRFLSPEAENACKYVPGLLGKDPLHVRELNLSEHKLKDMHMKYLAALLQDKHCKLSTIQLFKCSITEKQCRILTSALKSNPSHLRELDLSVSQIKNTGVNHLCDVLKDPHFKLERLRLRCCEMTDEGCSAVTSALKSNPSHLKELDLSENKLGDSGVKNLSDLLMNPQCKLEKLEISGCEMTDEGCSAVTSALKSNPSHLRELDLSVNQIKNTGVNHLCDVLKDPHFKLERLRLRCCEMTDEGCSAVTSALKSNPSHLKELNLSGNELGQLGVTNLRDLLMNRQCKLEILNLCGCSITEKQCLILTSALKSNPSHLRELDLSVNQIKNTGVNHLCDVLKDPHFKLERLRLRCCEMTDEGCSAVTSALKSNPSHLKELNLSGNELGQLGVTNLRDLLMNRQCKLEILNLCGCSITEKQCLILTSALKSNPSHLRELDLSVNQIKNTGVNHLCDVLKDPHFKLERLRLRCCEMTDEGCSAVTSALKSNPSHLKELNLSGNELGQLGVTNLRDLLMNRQCKLEILNLCGCSITEKQCLILTSALKSNPSHLRELDLSVNQIKNTGVNHLCDVLKDPHFKLERLRLRCCEMTDEGCSAVTSALKSNPSHLKELDLSENKLGDSGVKNLSDLLMNPQCKLEKLEISGCEMTDEGCSAVTSALKSNPSHLRELDLSVNQIKNTGVNHLCDVLKDPHFKLERLRLRCCEMTDEGCSAVTSALKSNPSHLKELNLSGNELGQLGVTNLRDLLMNRQCKLEILNLCGCSITEKQCLILTSALKSNPSHLRELDLSVNQIKNTGVNHLCDVLKDPHCKLERLSLNECGITDVTSLVQSLAGTKALQFLTELDLSKNNLGDSKEQLRKVLQGTNCKLSLEKEHWYSYITGFFTRQSKSQKSAKSGRLDQSTSGGAVAGEESGQRTDESNWQESGSSV
ncbi:LOW QUALITY PROTEIN: protein NLRC5-like [Sinocyclocheilus rhinocerous]|uniref:LOW QUALITY PROTEIN: protein NLRC5-like n=1 Tax=Sinocyclocheilus rhinocerous TaxID=307959 RepID=UPI0007B7F04C|nr:PREDICTED: LOW QUALITY PROTEIN: protein NLRC5-like [Sinocyclocheilus rhinocerous]